MHLFANSLGNIALVLTKFTINENVTTDTEPQISLSGRRAGFQAWLLNLIGIDTTTELDIFKNRIEYRFSNLSGQMFNVIPLSAISVGTSGYTKPFILFVLAIVDIILSLVALATEGVIPFLILLLIGLLFLMGYYFKKVLSIMITTHSSFNADFAFKRSVIEGVTVDFDQARKVIEILNRNLIEQTRK